MRQRIKGVESSSPLIYRQSDTYFTLQNNNNREIKRKCMWPKNQTVQDPWPLFYHSFYERDRSHSNVKQIKIYLSVPSTSYVGLKLEGKVKSISFNDFPPFLVVLIINYHFYYYGT